MVAMSISAAGLIRIEPLDGHGHQLALDIAALSALGPLFHLPDLEDQASGSDRLLGSLKGNAVQLGDRSVSLPVVSPKGKEKQLPQEAISTVRPSVWEDVANLPAPRIFQVGLSSKPNSSSASKYMGSYAHSWAERLSIPLRRHSSLIPSAQYHVRSPVLRGVS